MGNIMTVDELKTMLSDKELMAQLPMSKTMIDYIVKQVQEKVNEEIDCN